MAALIDGVYYSGDSTVYAEYQDTLDAGFYQSSDVGSYDGGSGYVEEGIFGFEDDYLYQPDTEVKPAVGFDYQLLGTGTTTEEGVDYWWGDPEGATSESYAPELPPDEKPWYDWVLPGDQDSVDDLVPLWDEDSSGWWDTVTPGGSDSPLESMFGEDEHGDANNPFASFNIESLIPILLVVSMFND